MRQAYHFERPHHIVWLPTILILLSACSKDPPPIGAPIKVANSAPCAPSEAALETLKAAKGSEAEFYRVLDRVQGIEVNAGFVSPIVGLTLRVRRPPLLVEREAYSGASELRLS